MQGTEPESSHVKRPETMANRNEFRLLGILPGADGFSSCWASLGPLTLPLQIALSQAVIGRSFSTQGVQLGLLLPVAWL